MPLSEPEIVLPPISQAQLETMYAVLGAPDIQLSTRRLAYKVLLELCEKLGSDTTPLKARYSFLEKTYVE